MANSNKRVKEYETVHHLVSRIAHKVYFLKDDERKDFLEIVRRTAEFAGIRLLGWCVMGNHFHLLVYLPRPEVVDEGEILRRYGILKGEKAASNQERLFAEWRMKGDAGEKRVADWLEGQRRRMYNVGEFMKIVKQWFTAEYNSRNAHKGTLWEAAYFDRPVKLNSSEMAKCLGYIHLNPIRAAMADKFNKYPWSSYTAFCQGEPISTAGMRFIYGEEMLYEEIVEVHDELLASLLEEEELRRAEEIARKRAAGYEVPDDPLTSEALVAQQSARLNEIQNAALEFREALVDEQRQSKRKELREQEILSLLMANPEIKVSQLAERISMGMPSVYKILQKLKKNGMISQEGYCGRWIVKDIK